MTCSHACSLRHARRARQSDIRGCKVWDAVGEAAQPKKLPLAGGETYSGTAAEDVAAAAAPASAFFTARGG